MHDSSAIRDKMYGAYVEFCNVAERKRHWSIFNDVPWDQLDDSLNSERKAARIETYCAEEFYLPDYTAGGIQLTRSIFGAAWFHARWSYEESKHGLVFREYLTRSGMRSQQEFRDFEDAVFTVKWKPPFATRRQMSCYGALQEAATYLAYKARKDEAVREGDKVLEAIFTLVSRDEAAHAGFYRAMARIPMATIPGVGPIGATLLSIKVVDARGFKSARNFAAWLGLTPKNHSTAGKNRLGVITRAGDGMLRAVLVAGATAVIADTRRCGARCCTSTRTRRFSTPAAASTSSGPIPACTCLAPCSCGVRGSRCSTWRRKRSR